MKSQAKLVVLLAVGLLLTIGTVGQAAIFTWTGGTDLDWETADNWLGGSVPLQSDMGAPSGGPWNTVVFTGSTMPTSNVKNLGYNGFYNYTSKLRLDRGGLLSMGIESHQNGLSSEQYPRPMLTIGDGIGGGSEDVTLQFTEPVTLARHTGGVFTTTVNSDGAFDVQGTLTMVYNETRGAILDVVGGSVTADRFNIQYHHYNDSVTTTQVELSDGGSFTVDGIVDNTMLTWPDSTGTILFQDKSSAYFMAQYGGDLPDLATVQGSLGTLFVSETDWTLLAEDVGGGYFKVTAVPEPGCLALCAIGALCLLTGRRRNR